MDRKEAGELAKIMQAYADGKTIQVKALANDNWTDINNPSFSAPIGCYRIKPEPRKFTIWVNTDGYVVPSHLGVEKVEVVEVLS